MSQYPQVPAMPVQETNGLGIAAFVCSIVGLFTAGILCPIGVILALVALGRPPRGFAVAGLIVGLVGSCGGILLFLVAGTAMLAAIGIAVAAVALTETEKVEITTDMAMMGVAIKQYESENDYLPADLGVLSLKTATTLDPWGHPYEYHLIETKPGFDIVSGGEDGRFGTADDVRFTALGEAWEAGGFGLNVERSADGKSVRINVGGRTITAEDGEGTGGHVSIDLGDRVIEIVDDESGGRIDVKEKNADAPDAPDSPDSPDSPKAPDGS